MQKNETISAFKLETVVRIPPTRQLVHEAGQPDGHPVVHVQHHGVAHDARPEADLLPPVLLRVLRLVVLVVVLILLLVVILLLPTRKTCKVKSRHDQRFVPSKCFHKRRKISPGV